MPMEVYNPCKKIAFNGFPAESDFYYLFPFLSLHMVQPLQEPQQEEPLRFLLTVRKTARATRAATQIMTIISVVFI
jgi:hypothetical protein